MRFLKLSTILGGKTVGLISYASKFISRELFRQKHQFHPDIGPGPFLSPTTIKKVPEFFISSIRAWKHDLFGRVSLNTCVQGRTRQAASRGLCCLELQEARRGKCSEPHSAEHISKLSTSKLEKARLQNSFRTCRDQTLCITPTTSGTCMGSPQTQ